MSEHGAGPGDGHVKLVGRQGVRAKHVTPLDARWVAMARLELR
jgi:hypothetical protein